ncbi:eCIS core domain-containing protein [Streptomyces sp. NBC_00448]|uniref:eCIS core domain-containing protein n=1 Tax=Streptomyces sp. NBC_00448 TaxID=2903652 RepID=UPI003FA7D40B
MGNAAVVQMLRTDGPARKPHRHGPGSGHQQAGQESAVQRSAVHDVLRSGGRPLDGATRADMESRLGADFSDVRIHDDATARASAAEIDARAYTSGNHVVIGDGGDDTHTLAHELTHVVQQRQGAVAGTDNGSGLKVSDPSDRFEQEAEANATRVMSGPAPAQPIAAGPEEAAAHGATAEPAVQRKTTQVTVQRRGGAAVSGVMDAFSPAADAASAGMSPSGASSNALTGMSLGAAVVGTGMKSKELYDANAAKKASAAGTAKHHIASRDEKAAGNDVFSNISGTGSQAASLAGGLVGEAAANHASLAGTGIGLPSSVLQVGRYARKSYKADQRIRALRALMAKEEAPAEALKAAKDLLPALLHKVREADEELRRAKREYTSRIQELDERATRGEDVDRGSLKPLKEAVDQAETDRTAAEAELTRGEQEYAALKPASDAMHEAVKGLAEKAKHYDGTVSDEISLRDIQAYAVRKNASGRLRKGITAVGSMLSIGGSIASIIATAAIMGAAVAGAGAVAATPVGWGLAAAAAAVALGLASYKGWKKLSHRWHQTGVPDARTGAVPSKRKRLLQTLNLTKDVGVNEREQHAAALYRLAADGPDAKRVEEARATLDALGLSWDEMKNDEEGGKKLIAAKLASG